MQNFLSDEKAREIGLKQVLQKLPTQTPYGKEVKDKIVPFFSQDVQDLRKALKDLGVLLEAIEKDYQLLRELKNLLGDLKDIKGSIYRGKTGEVLNEVEFFEIKKQVMSMEKLRKFLLRGSIGIEAFELLSMEDLLKKLDPENTGIETFYIYDAYSEKLTAIRGKKKEIEGKIFHNNKEAKEDIFKEFAIKPKLNGEIVVLKEEEELLEKLLTSNKVYQTAENFKQFIFRIKPSKALKELKAQSEDLKLLEEEEEFKVRQMLSKTIGDNASSILENINTIGMIDFMMGKAILALQIKGVAPRIVDEPFISIKEGRHIVIEEGLKKQGLKYTPVDVTLKRGVTLITGANMGGKTITLKMMALITAMAQLGLYVPAEEAVIGPVTFIYFSSGDQQSEEKGLSTFGAEIEALNHIVERVEEGGLILIDELARGTNPLEGYGISRGVLEYLKKKPSLSVITTHFDGLSNVEGIKHFQIVGLKNVSIATLKEELQQRKGYRGVLEKHMDYRLEDRNQQTGPPKDAIMIARLMGLKEEIIEEAQKSISEREGQRW
ncbi:lysine 5,6-aminomutase reactivase ATPase KamC [Natronincola ferrireducens]|uniref:MutS domain V n=1 Tax=Natronincola ferrireducens TaxID=393762 RepID=A0A1G9FGA9_9FIRM|nr:DNA mismatch repair protein MutS [Natronincola ferrireducens]SDK87392.1 MutS domain V [Natronincola ferrireducens]